jgi:hypothetical protein
VPSSKLERSSLRNHTVMSPARALATATITYAKVGHA